MTRHVPRKRFGQHFLVDEGVIAQIVAAVRPRPEETVVEIGPGLGALTRPLSETCHLHVVEIDRDLAAHLRRAFPSRRLTVHEGDVLQFDFAALGNGLRIVGNLPYNISTPVLFCLARSALCLRDAHLMLQKEVVQRMVARPSSGEFGRLSVMLQYHFQMTNILEVPPSAFRPAPRVDSAVVRLEPAPADRQTANDEVLFSELVASAFSQRRKMLRNTLRDYFSPGELNELGLDPRGRAQDLAVADFVRAANSLTRKKER